MADYAIWIVEYARAPEYPVSEISLAAGEPSRIECAAVVR